MSKKPPQKKAASQKVTIALAQMDVGPDRKKNLRRALRMVADAAKEKAAIICLPELFDYMGSFKKPKEIAETRRGEAMTALREAAEKHGLYIVAGSILEKNPHDLPANACYLIDPHGGFAARYAKMHLFDIEVPGKIRFRESEYMRPGKHVTVAEMPIRLKDGTQRRTTIGFGICNDLRYPELFRKMALAGAKLIFLPAAFTKFTGRDHWLSLIRVRAIENQCFVCAVNQSGKNADGVRFFGASCAVDPWGKVLAEAPPKGNALVTATIDLALVDRIRRQLPALRKIHRTYPLRRCKVL